MITVSNLFYEYPGKRALDDVSFVIPEGSITALVGPNGAGKSTLLRCIAALDEPFSGAIQVAGIDVSEHPRRVHKALGYLSDFFGLYNDLTISQCLLFSASLHQMEGSKASSQVEWAMSLLALEEYRNQKAGALSRGWRQRLGIAQAIIHKPRLLLLDEPASGLDPEARLLLSGLFHTLRDQGMTLVVSSHILAELEDYCTDMLVLRDGKVIEHRTNSSAKSAFDHIEIWFLDEPSQHVTLLRGIQDVGEITLDGYCAKVMFTGDAEAQYALLKQLMDAGARVRAFAAKQRRLQDVYMALSDEGKSA